MSLNPLGFVMPFDFGTAHIISVKAREALSGGQLVSISGAANAVTSGVASFVSADIEAAAAGSGLNVGGVAIANVASGGYVGVATQGMCILVAGGTVTGGLNQEAITNDGTIDAVSGVKVFGRAFSTATSGNFALVNLNI